MSQWEPPLWLDEIDPTTGAVYYVNSYTGDPQVRRPFFVDEFPADFCTPVERKVGFGCCLFPL